MYSSSETQSESESSISSDEDIEIPKIDTLLELSFDPRIDVSDHSSDCDKEGLPIPSTSGYREWDTDDSVDDDEEKENEEHLMRLDQPISNWCDCNKCVVMSTDLECYCRRKSGLIADAIIGDKKVHCVTEVDIFKSTIEDKEVLELSAYRDTRKQLPTEKDGSIKPEALRYATYHTFLNICTIRNPGKSRRFVLPACVVNKVRELYPSPDGIYTDYKPAKFNDRI